jgi:hypothetical protein
MPKNFWFEAAVSCSVSVKEALELKRSLFNRFRRNRSEAVKIYAARAGSSGGYLPTGKVPISHPGVTIM